MIIIYSDNKFNELLELSIIAVYFTDEINYLKYF